MGLRPQVISGQRIICTINAQPIAAGHVLDYSLDTSFIPIQTIDNPLPDELAPNAISCSMSLRVYRTPDNDPVQSRFAVPGDPSSASDDASDSPLKRFTECRYITIEVRDKTTDQTVFYVPQAVIVRRSGSVTSQDLLVETWSIIGIGWYGPTKQTTGLIPTIKSAF